MLTELKCGKTHIQFFIEGNCIATVRNEYAEVVKAAIEASLVPVANRDDTNSTRDQTGEKNT